MRPAVDLAALSRTAQTLFTDPDAGGTSLALVVDVGGEVVAERYGVQPATPFGPSAAVDAETPLVSWSMAKSITHAAVGVLVGDGRLDPAAPAPVSSWRGTAKERITLQQLLEMRSGLRFVEDYVDAGVSHCIEMLFGSGHDDTAAYAADLPLDHEPGKVWNYSSGTTNIVSRIVGDLVDGVQGGDLDPARRRAAMERFLRERVFSPAGMASARPVFDAAGTFIGSSYVHAPAREFARFGRWYLRRGVGIDGRRSLPEGWTDHGRKRSAVDTETGFEYGAHWWRWPDLPGSLAAHGYEGQYTLVVPDRDLVLVHLGKYPAARRTWLEARLRELVAAVAPGDEEGRAS